MNPLRVGISAVALNDALHSRQAFSKVFCGHYRDHFNPGIEAEKETFTDFRDLRRLRHIHHEKSRPFSAFREEIGGFRLQFFKDARENFFDLSVANSGIASLDRKRELDHDAHWYPP